MEIKIFNNTGLANSYLLVEENAAVLIDPVIELEDLGDIEVQYCLATHGHADHIKNAKTITDHFNIPLTLHKDEAIYAQDDSYNLSHYVLGKELTKIDNLNLLNDGDSLLFFDHKIEVLHTPGHTLGSVMYLVDDTYLFSGDTVFKNAIGRTDLKGSNPNQMKNTIDKLLLIDKNWQVYAGHGDSTNWQEVRESLKYLRRLV